jgi:DNA-binding response OmpR family regulator
MTIHCPGEYDRALKRIAEQDAAIEDLRYQVDHWKREAYQLVDSDRTHLIQERFPLTHEEAMVCNALYGRRDKFLPGTYIEGLLDEVRGGNTEASLVSQLVSRIRRKLGDDMIENVRSRGYRMSAKMLKQMDRKLKG